MTNVNLKRILSWVMVALFSTLIITTANAKTTTPKLLGIETVEFEETSDDIFAWSIPYTDLAPLHQQVVLKYKPLVLKAIAASSGAKVADYHVKRAAMSEEAPRGTMLLYYETIYNKKICEVSAVSVDQKGNYSIKTSLC